MTVIDRVAERFGLGRPAEEPVVVPGGLSNELWRVVTREGAYAVKRMIVNADRPGFVANVEAAFQVERRAAVAGIAMPAPIVVPSTGRALAEVDGSLFRVHRWVDGQPAAGTAREAATLLATIHAVGNPRWATLPGPAWTADRWGSELAELARRVAPGPEPMLVVDSHRDLDRKNVLRTADGRLRALDWDAAGPTGAVQEAVSVAWDWSDGDRAAFGEAVRAYGRGVPAQPWVFGGWVAAQGGWLDYNATSRSASPLGQAEVANTLTRLRELASNLDTLLSALADQS